MSRLSNKSFGSNVNDKGSERSRNKKNSSKGSNQSHIRKFDVKNSNDFSVSLSEEEDLKVDDEMYLSDTSTVRDASMVFNHSIDSEDDFLVDVKKRPKNFKLFITAEDEEEEGQVRDRKETTEAQQQTTQATRPSLATVKMPYDDYISSKELLKHGFLAQKFNYSNFGTKQVRVFLSQDEKYLCYEPLEKTLSSRLLFSVRKYPVKKIYDFLYGGLSQTFKKHNADNL